MTRILIDKETNEEFEVKECPALTPTRCSHILCTVTKREPEPREFEEVDKLIQKYGMGSNYGYQEFIGDLSRAIVAEALRQADRRYQKL